MFKEMLKHQDKIFGFFHTAFFKLTETEVNCDSSVTIKKFWARSGLLLVPRIELALRKLPALLKN